MLAVAALAWAYSGNPWTAVAVLVGHLAARAAALAARSSSCAAARASRARGVLTRTRALEAFERASEVIFDKTGTPTLGRLALARVLPLASLPEREALELAASLEAQSRHPAAGAFAGAAPRW